MSLSRNTFIDFDGTLVHENSSQILMDTLMTRATTRGERLLVWAFAGPAKRFIRLGMAVLTRLAGERDVSLLVVLWAYRRALTARGDELFAEVAGRLTLNGALEGEFSRPFSIASTGLGPVIEAFLALNPQLQCVAMYSSGITTGSEFSVRLVSTSRKMRTIDSFMPTVYFTDYDKEVKMLKRVSQTPVSVRVIPVPDGKEIYRLALRK